MVDQISYKFAKGFNRYRYVIVNLGPKVALKVNSIKNKMKI
jgi:hypothetical protein